jgi:3-phosphoshikimate 1-carboxyvinyltransferase
LGGQAEEGPDSLTVQGGLLIGGTVDGANDHRIVMAAAIAATACKGPVTILGAEAVNKSYPSFWTDYQRVGGEIHVL